VFSGEVGGRKAFDLLGKWVSNAEVGRLASVGFVHVPTRFALPDPILLDGHMLEYVCMENQKFGDLVPK
jgi:hypothetical protein